MTSREHRPPLVLFDQISDPMGSGQHLGIATVCESVERGVRELDHVLVGVLHRVTHQLVCVDTGRQLIPRHPEPVRTPQ